MNNESVSHFVITIENFPSRRELYSLIEQFLTENKYFSNYKTKNADNVVKFFFRSESIALALMKHINYEKISNQLYKNTMCSLSIEEVPTYAISLKKKKLEIQTEENNGKGESNRRIQTNSYNHLHLKDINAKAGIMSTASPYLTEIERERMKEKEKEKKIISKEKFKLFFGSALKGNNYYIQNYVNLTPSKPVSCYSFREVQKSKWIGNKNFRVCEKLNI